MAQIGHQGSFRPIAGSHRIKIYQYLYTVYSGQKSMVGYRLTDSNSLSGGTSGIPPKEFDSSDQRYTSHVGCMHPARCSPAPHRASKRATIYPVVMNHPPFSILYADPPWQFTTRSSRVGSSTSSHRRPPYPTLDIRAISALSVVNLCADDCVLFLWATYPLLPQALQVIAAWGFCYKTVAFTWVKRTRADRGFHFGMGYWTRANPELCLLATRGHPRRVSSAVPNLIVSPVQEHSRKPAGVRERIVTLCGDVPRAELFAREKAPGWSVWGNEVESDFRLEYAT
jgi:N6-adenosine-specific RNA methylase IME4